MKLDPSQELAVDLILRAHVGVVTGGAGVGKSTCLRFALDQLDELGRTYLLAAPTGKAARRMKEATGREAITVHRLLSYSPRKKRFLRDEDDPIDADLVVVDEASMLDTELADALALAVQDYRVPGGSDDGWDIEERQRERQLREHPTRLVLIGDANQLPSVGCGRVFGDLIDSGAIEVARLTTLHRAEADRWVATQAPEVLAGRVPDLEARDDFRFFERKDRSEAVDAVVDVVGVGLPRRGVAADEVQVLVPQNVGPAGADLINARLRDVLNPAGQPGAPDPGSWKIGGDVGPRGGDRVIQTWNDYGRGVMNGEIGRVTDIEAEDLTVEFDGQLVVYDRDAATHLRLAYALTVHKSQGSEWPWVVVLCHSTHTRMLERTLLYTAITRARKGVVIVGDRVGIERAVKTQNAAKRNTGLVERLTEARDEGPDEEE